MSQLVAKILSLIKQGITDQAIVKELDVSDEAIEAIAYIRARPNEFSLCRSSLASGNSADDN